MGEAVWQRVFDSLYLWIMCICHQLDNEVLVSVVVCDQLDQLWKSRDDCLVVPVAVCLWMVDSGYSLFKFEISSDRAYEFPH